VVRALVAGGIMAAPALGFGTNVLLKSPDHTGTGVPVMVILLLLDRLRPRWYVPPLIVVLLVWVQAADMLAIPAAAIPIALVGVARVVRCGRGSAGRAWYDLLLSAMAIASVPLTAVTVSALHASGGFYLHPVPGPLLASPSAWPAQARTLGQCVLMLFGADIIGQQFGLSYVFALLHMAGVAAGAAGLAVGIRGFFSRLDRVSQVLVASILTMLGAAFFGTLMGSIFNTHDIAVLLPCGAALAGRQLGGPLARARLEPVLGMVLVGYAAALGFGAAQPAVPAANQALASWLVSHGLHSGLAGYWQANSVALDSGGQVTLAPIFGGAPYAWAAKSSWYDPGVSTANFVVTVSWPPAESVYVRPAVMLRVFGPPVHTYVFQRYTIMVWDKNLLSDLAPAPPPPSSGGIPRFLAGRPNSLGPRP
jgi:hypothetical protein